MTPIVDPDDLIATWYARSEGKYFLPVCQCICSSPYRALDVVTSVDVSVPCVGCGH
jgi:hypothetical protein